MSPNPYEPPTPVPTDELGIWQRIIQALRRPLSRRQFGHHAEYDAETAESVLSGRMIFEYGVVFSAWPNDIDHFFAAMPLKVDDEIHRQRNITEAARVLRALVARVDGLEDALGTRDLVVSMVPSYQELGTEICRVIIPADSWRRSDESDELDLQIPEFD